MEIWDLYNKDRIKTEKTIQRGKKLPEGYYHIVVHVCIFNSKGEMLIQQRQPFKSGWSNLWDLSAGGSATTGDTSQQAAEREVFEELGYKLSLGDIRPTLTINFNEGFDDIYLIEREIDLKELKLQYEEVQDVKWATMDEILQMIEQGLFIPYHRGLIELLFFMRLNEGTKTNRNKWK